MPMTICTKPVPVRVPSPNMQQQQSHLRLERELSQTFERLRHIHSHPPPPEPTDVVCLAAHPHRPILGPDPACLPFPGQQGEVVPSSSSPYSSLTSSSSPYSSLTSSSSPYSSLTSSSSSSSSSCCSSSIDNWSKNGSPRQKRRVVFADSLGLPLADVRVFTCEPPDDAPPPCPMALRRGQRSLAVRGKQPCQQHHSAPANGPQPCADFPQFPARQVVQDKRTLQAHNDTLRRVNKTCPRVPLPQTMAKAHAHPPSSSHTQITEHTHPAACSHPPLEQAQVLGHTPPMGHTQRFAHTLLPKAHALSPSHTQGQRATYTAGHTHAPAEHAQRISHTLPKAHALHASSLQRPQATAEHTHPVLNTQQPTTAYTPSHQFAHTLPKGLGHAPGGGGTQGSPQQRHPSCGHLVSGTRQPLAPVPAGWPPRSRSPQLQALPGPGPGSLPHVQNFAGHKWALQEGMMAVH